MDNKTEAYSSSIACGMAIYLSSPVLGIHTQNQTAKLGSDSNPSLDERRSANYKPSTWNHDFLPSLCNTDQDQKYKDRAKELEEKIRFNINNKNEDFLTILELIDDIQRLGLAHRFEKDIKRALDMVILRERKGVEAKREKLHATALKFRLLRQHGYDVSQVADVFKPFTNGEGNFMASMEKDVKGILSLYEASFLAFEGETLMEKALLFSTTQLHQLKNETKDQAIFMHELICRALEVPLHHRAVRLEARWHIESYSKQKNPNLLLLELALLDFNMAQSMFREDLQELSRWWKKIDVANKLGLVKDRLRECFFWTVGMFPKPQHSNCRKVLTKIGAFITTIDDIYDVYATFEELEVFTAAIERWDVGCMNNLPDYMKLCFLALYNTINEMAYDILKEEGLNIIPYLNKAWADLGKAFLQEAKWNHNKYTPTFKDYLDNGIQSASGVLILVHSYFLLNKSINKETLEYLKNYPNLLRWPSLIFRLCNDLATSKVEIERGETANSILCNMRDTGVSEEHARENIRGIVANTWEKMNEEQYQVDSNKHQLSKAFVQTTINLARTAQCAYQYGDRQGAPDARALSAIMKPILVGFKKKKCLSVKDDEKFKVKWFSYTDDK